MMKLQQLIQDMCPNGVEFKTLGEVCTCTKGQQLNKSGLLDEGYPVINGGINPSGYWDEYNYPANTITISQGGASAGYVNYMQTPFWAGAHCYVLINAIPEVNYKFLYYLVKQSEPKLMQCQYGAGIPALGAKTVNALEIPIPPLEIQERIVAILDAFSSLAAELQAELQMRRKQYEYYRTQLLTPHSESNSADNTDDCNWEWKTLGEICISIKDGMHNLPESSIIQTDYPIISAQNIYENRVDYVAKRYVDKDTFLRENKRTNVEVGDVLLTIVATIGRSAVVKEDRPVLLQRSVCVLKPNKDIYPEFLKFSLDTNRVQSFMMANAHGAAQAGLYLNQVEQIKIALPPFDEQKRIADLLGKFDKLITSMEEGLPAEMDRQQKRYEYYRDLLLTFPRKEV